MWFTKFFKTMAPRSATPPLYLYNTLTKQKDAFSLPVGVRRVRMYNCGPTVYGVQHVGNLSMFVFTDILRRTLEFNGFDVQQVINITDVGHLSSDADAGEDKMALGLKREKMKLTLANMRLLADKYADIFITDIEKLNVDTSKIQFPRASDHIPAQIAMIKTLQEKGYAYKTEDGVYFDTSRFPRYGELGGIDLEGLKEGARIAMVEGKRNPTDFALWKLNSKLGWESPWGTGFPGWHIECSAMIRVTLGEKIDIHTGGIEHVPIHHNNEIAQSECATGKRPFSRFWLHRAHVQIEGGKIAKSKGNVVYLTEVIEKGFHPLALRYLFLQAHYRSPSNFSWDALAAAQNALANLLQATAKASAAGDSGRASPSWMSNFRTRINDDLDTPGALAVVWDMIKDSSLSLADLVATLTEMDKVLGLNLHEPDEAAQELLRKEIVLGELPAEIRELIQQREEVRKAKDWQKADELRGKIANGGFIVEDSTEGPRISKQ